MIQPKNSQDNTSIVDFKFPSFNDEPANLKINNFTFEDLEQKTRKNPASIEKKLRIERDFADNAHFEISPIVRQHRGINKLENEEKETRISEEVSRRVAEIEQDAYNKGFTEGQKIGQAEVFKETRAVTEEKLISFTEMINFVLQTQEEIINQQKSELYLLLKNLTKWIILRELKDDGEYIERLLEKLIRELKVKSNLLIKVNENGFKGMEDVLQTVQENLGELENVRVEVDYDVDECGLIVETKNAIIDGTMEQQFLKLDELFRTVVGSDG